MSALTVSRRVRWRPAPGLWLPAGAFVVLALLPQMLLCLRWVAALCGQDGATLISAAATERTLRLFGDSFLLATVVSVLAAVIGTGLAFWLLSDGRMQRIGRVVYLVPLLIPPYIYALQWLAVAGRRQFLDRLFDSISFTRGISVPAYGFWPTALVLTLSLFPVVTLLVRRGMDAIEPELLEAGRLLSGPGSVARKIVLPLLMPSIVSGTGLVFVLAFVEYGVPSLLQQNVYIMDVYASFSQYFDPVRSFGGSVPLIVVAALILAISQAKLRNSPLKSRQTRTYLAGEQLPVPMQVWTSLCAIVATAAIAVPIVVLLFRVGSPLLLIQSISSEWQEISRTLVIAAVTGLITVVVAVPLAFALVRRTTKTWWFMLAIPLAIPAPVTGIALVYAWNSPLLDWGYGTLLMLVLAHLARFLPFAVFAAASGVRNVDPVLLEAASLHDVGKGARLFKVVLPMLAPAIITTWLVSFVLSLGELGASLIISPPGQATLPMVVYNLLHYGATDTVSALSVIILLAAGAACLVALVLYMRVGKWVQSS